MGQEHAGGGVSVGAAAAVELAPPDGLAEIVATFGDISAYVSSDGQLDPRWQAEFMTRVALPFPLVLSWDHSKLVSSFTCHRRLAKVFTSVLGEMVERGLQGKVRSFSGCFAFRMQRTGHKLSTHSWGIAIDLNAETNQLGTPGDMDAGVIEVFRRAGFKWGGDWVGTGKDPMHFQFCTGY